MQQETGCNQVIVELDSLRIVFVIVTLYLSLCNYTQEFINDTETISSCSSLKAAEFCHAIQALPCLD